MHRFNICFWVLISAKWHCLVDCFKVAEGGKKITCQMIACYY